MDPEGHTSPDFPVDEAFHILVVEDDFVTLKAVEQLLRKCSYRVTTARDGKEALSILAAQPGNKIDLILTDILMPELDGLELIQQVMAGSQQHARDIPVVVMSSQDSQDDVLKAFEAGACDYLIKPVRRNEASVLWQHVWRHAKSNGKSAGVAAPHAAACGPAADSGSGGRGDEQALGGTGLDRAHSWDTTEEECSALRPAEKAGEAAVGAAGAHAAQQSSDKTAERDSTAAGGSSKGVAMSTAVDLASCQHVAEEAVGQVGPNAAATPARPPGPAEPASARQQAPSPQARDAQHAEASSGRGGVAATGRQGSLPLRPIAERSSQLASPSNSGLSGLTSLVVNLPPALAELAALAHQRQEAARQQRAAGASPNGVAAAAAARVGNGHPHASASGAEAAAAQEPQAAGPLPRDQSLSLLQHSAKSPFTAFTVFLPKKAKPPAAAGNGHGNGLASAGGSEGNGGSTCSAAGPQAAAALHTPNGSPRQTQTGAAQHHQQQKQQFHQDPAHVVPPAAPLLVAAPNHHAGFSSPGGSGSLLDLPHPILQVLQALSSGQLQQQLGAALAALPGPTTTTASPGAMGHLPQDASRSISHHHGLVSHPAHPGLLLPAQLQGAPHSYNANGSGHNGSAANGHNGSHRVAALTKYLEKKKRRSFDKKVRYESRKRLAEARPRVRGQFVKQSAVTAAPANGGGAGSLVALAAAARQQQGAGDEEEAEEEEAEEAEEEGSDGDELQTTSPTARLVMQQQRRAGGRKMQRVA